MNHETENRTNYKQYDNVIRPPLCKKFTNLHLSGSLYMNTENGDQFLPYKVKKRQKPTRIITNLHLEGTLFLEQSEYRRSFVAYKHYKKQKPLLPLDHINSPVDISNIGENNEFKQSHPVIPNLRSPKFEEKLERKASWPPFTNFERTWKKELEEQSKKNERFVKPQHRITPMIPNLKPPGLSSNETTSCHIKIYNKMYERDQNTKYFRKTSAANIAQIIEPPAFIKNAKREKGLKMEKNKWIPTTQRKLTDINKQHFEERFECQPEYRKAYISHLLRERSPTRNTDGCLSDDNSGASELMRIPLQTIKSTKKIKKNLDKIETAVFGPKCRSGSISGTSSEELFNAKRSPITKTVVLQGARNLPLDDTSDNKMAPAFVVLENIK